MKNLYFWLLTISLISFNAATHAEGFFKWKDARGHIQYGDKPPPNVKAERMKMPAITVIDNYAEQWKPVAIDNMADEEQPAEEASNQGSSNYSKLEFVAPKANQSIRANDGDVSAMISVKPPLKGGHEIVFLLDGKEVSRGSSRTSNFANLTRGAHTISAKIVDEQGKTLKTNSVSFNVLRFSKLFKKKP
jgi:hypothetical protein